MTFGKDLRARLAGQLARGELILFTGAGFSQGAPTKAGAQVPSTAQLCESLWPLAFPDEPIEDGADIGDVLACSIGTAKRATANHLKERLMVTEEGLPGYFNIWFSQPWHRIYTLNIDDLDEVASRAWPLPRALHSVSAITSTLPSAGPELYSVHLNGRVSDYPDITFSPQQYAERVARPDPWYMTLAHELVGHPVVFVGTELNEAPLWYHMELRKPRGTGRRELRPGSYLICPTLPAARRTLLRDLNVTWVQMQAEEFATEILAGLSAEAAAGHATIKSAAQPRTTYLLEAVGDVRNVPVPEPAEYLLGREPMWGDLVHGFAVHRDFEADLAARVAALGPGLVAITGTGGVGKSTTAMRLGLVMHGRGSAVGWLQPLIVAPLTEVRRRVRESHFEVILIDNADRFGREAGSLLAELVRDSPQKLFIAVARSSRADSLGIRDAIETVEGTEFSVPHLEDTDIGALIDALDRANRLGRLKGMSQSARERELRVRCGRQLLVAMIEATSGKKFEEKIAGEYRDLGASQRAFYGTIVLATYIGGFITRDEVLLATGLTKNEDLNWLQRLVDVHLVVAAQGQLRARHAVIAEHVFHHIRQEGHLVEIVRGLAFSMATRVDERSRGKAREVRMLSRLVSHDWLLTNVGLGGARRVFDEVEDQLEWDAQYWLQRGSAEVEKGNLSHAENYLAQAQSLDADDYKIRTEVAYLAIKRASCAPEPRSRRPEVERAFADLEDSIALSDGRDRYPFHVLGSQGLRWVKRAGLSPDERAEVLLRLRRAVDQGVQRHPRAPELEQLAKDLQREYLMAAVADDGTASEA